MRSFIRLVGHAIAGFALVAAGLPALTVDAEGPSGLARARSAVADAGVGGASVAGTHVVQGAGHIAQTIPTAASEMIPDDRGDAYWGRGDIVAVQTSASLGMLQLITYVDLYEDPGSVNWQIGETYIRWTIDVDGDGTADFSAWLVNAEGSVAVAVLRESDFTLTCVVEAIVVPSQNAYVLGFPMECVDAPESFSWNVEMYFEDLADPTVSHDRAPDEGWSGPVAIPDGATQQPTSYTAVQPSRLLDSRGAATCNARVQVAGRAGVPVDAVAAAITLTVPGATRSGYATVWPAGEAAPNASNVNYAAGETRANGAIVRLGADGAIEVSSSTCEPLLVDVNGAFAPVIDTSGSGRFVPITPVRAIDWNLSAGQDVVLTPDQLHIPATATAVSVNITIGGSQAGGFVTAWATGGSRPDASVLNTDGADQTRAAAGLVPVGASGITLAQNIGGRVIVDVTGYMTGAGELSLSGMFVPQSPARVLDTRPGRVTDWRSVEVPDGAGAIAANVTVTDAQGAGWLTLAPAVGGDVNATSTVNVSGPGQSTANFAITPVVDGVRVAAGGTTASAIVDLAGWFVE